MHTLRTTFVILTICTYQQILAFNCYGCSSDTSPTPEGTQTCIDSPQDIPDTQGRIIQCLPFDNDTVVDIWEWKCYTAHILEKSVNSTRFIRGCCSITSVDPYCKLGWNDDVMIDTDPDIPNRGYKQRIIRCKDDPGSEIPCNNHRAEFRDSYNSTTTTPHWSTTTSPWPSSPRTSTTTTTTTTTIQENCPSRGWVNANAQNLGCLHFTDESMTWEEAENYCESLTFPHFFTHLVEIFNIDQHEYLVKKAYEYEVVTGSPREWGLGLVNVGGDANRWIWSYSLSVPHFTQWNQGGSVPQGEFSAVMSPQLDYKWIDVSMQHQFYPICQFK